jgi:hypothetical protein
LCPSTATKLPFTSTPKSLKRTLCKVPIELEDSICTSSEDDGGTITKGGSSFGGTSRTDELLNSSEDELSCFAEDEHSSFDDDELDFFVDEELDCFTDDELDFFVDEELDCFTDDELDFFVDEELDTFSDEELDSFFDDELDFFVDEELDRFTDDELDFFVDEELTAFFTTTFQTSATRSLSSSTTIPKNPVSGIAMFIPGFTGDSQSTSGSSKSSPSTT